MTEKKKRKGVNNAVRLEDVRACEAIMRDVSKMSASLVAMERAVMSVTPIDVERVQGGTPIPAAVRLSEDPIRSGVIETLNVINMALGRLDAPTREIVISVYFIGMTHEEASIKLSLNRRTVCRRCREAIEHIAPSVLPMYGNVIKWREKWENDIVHSWT